MAQQTIDFGTFPDDPDADAIRTAFEKVQQNFDELYGEIGGASVSTINKTPGAGITVNQPTGNVVITANIACLQVRTSTLSIGQGANGNFTALITNSSQELVIDLPSTISNVTNLQLDGNASIGKNLVANTITSNSFLNVAGNANTGNLTVTGFVTATGNINGSSINASSSLSVIGNANVGNLGTGEGVFSGNVTAANVYANTGVMKANSGEFTYVSGNGANLHHITGANVSGQVPNALVASTVYTNAQPNITSLGTLSSLTVSGNVTAGNVSGGNLVSANYLQGTLTTSAQPNITSVGTLSSLNVSGSVTAASFVGNVSGNISGNISVPGGNTNVLFNDSSVVNATGGFTFDKTTNAVTIAGNLTANNANLGNLTKTNYLEGTLVTNAQPNITSVGVLTALTVNGNVSANLITGTLTTNAQPNITSVGTLSSLTVSGNASAGNMSAALVTGTLTTEAQPNVTSVGTLTGLNVNGTITAVNITANTGVFTGNGAGLTNLPGSNVSGAVGTATHSNTANTVTDNAQPNITSVGTLTSLNVSGSIQAGVGAGGNVTGANLVSANYFTGTLTTAAQPNITSVGTLTSLGVSGNITAANITANTGIFAGNAAGLTNIPGANVTGAVPTATVATTAGSVTTNAQPNITSVGTLSSLIVSGNVNAGNVSGTNGGFTTVTGTLTTAAQPNITSVGTLTGLTSNGNITVASSGTFVGNANGLTNIPGANVIGNVPNATYSTTAGSASTAGTVTTNAQPNVTSVGTLTTLSVSGNLTSGNANLGNAARANYFIGDGSLLTNISVAAGSYIVNGNSNVTVDANSNVRTSVGGTANVFVVTSTGANVVGTLGVTSNISAPNFVGNVSGRVLTAAQPNITSLGTLTGLTVNGVSNLGPNGNVIITGGSANQFLMTNGSGNLAWITPAMVPAGGTNTQIQFNDGGSYAGNAGFTFDKTTGNVAVPGGLAVTGNASAGNVAGGNLVSANFLTGILTTSAQPNVTSVGTLTNLNVSGNIQTGSGAGGNITGVNYITANYVTGTLTTASQPNITSVGTLASLAVTGNISAANITGNHFGNGSGLSAITGANVTGTVANATYATSAGSATTAGTVTTNAQPNITSVGSLTSLIVSGNINSGNISANNATFTSITGTLSTASQTNITSIGTLTGLNVNATVTAVGFTANTGVFTGNGSGLSAITGANVTGTVANATYATSAGSATTAGTVTASAQSNITSLGTLTSLIVNGNINAGNIAGGNLVSANYFSGNGSLLTAINGSNVTGQVSYAATANAVAGANVSGAVAYATTANAVAGANVSGTVANATYATSAGSATTAGTVTTASQPNITTASNLTSVGNITVGTWSATLGSISGANLTSVPAGNLNGTIPAVVLGNSTLYIGTTGVALNRASGSLSLTGVNIDGSAGSATTAGTVTTSAQPNITSVGTLSSLSVTGNANAGNLSTGGTVAATGNITGANIVTGGFHIRSVNTGISANGSTQGTATVLTREINIVAVAAAGEGVVLPAAVAGMVVYVTNNSTNNLLVYPASGGAINSLGTNAAFTQVPKATIIFIAPTTTQWYTTSATYA